MRRAGTSRVIHSDGGFIRDTLSGIGILHISKAIPHEPTDVEFVVQDAGATRCVPVDRARAPSATKRARNSFSIQVLGDLLRRDASDKAPEDPLDDRCLRRLDLPLAGRDASAVQRLDDSIPVAQAASRLAVFDSSAQPAVCFLGQVLQVKGVHRPLESDVQVGDVAFGKGDDVYAGKRQALE